MGDDGRSELAQTLRLTRIKILLFVALRINVFLELCVPFLRYDDGVGSQ